MKKFYLVTAIFLLLIIVNPGMMAQDEPLVPGMASMLPVEGYIIRTDGDTVWGKIKWSLKYIENNPVEIKFTSRNGTTSVYRAGEIKGFGNRVEVWVEDITVPVIMAMEHYVTVPSFKKGVPVFMNRLFYGRLTVYQNRSAAILSSSTVVTERRIDGIGFSFVPGEGLYIGPTYRTDYRIIKARSRFSSYYVVKNNGPMIKVDKEDYDKLFPDLFGDCPAIENEIKNNPDLAKFKNFMILAEISQRLCN